MVSYIDNYLSLSTAAAKAKAIGSSNPFYPRLRVSEWQASFIARARSATGFKEAFQNAGHAPALQQQNAAAQQHHRSKRDALKPAPSTCQEADKCAGLLNNFCSGTVSIAKTSCTADCDEKVDGCPCDESGGCDEFGGKKDGHTNCDESCANTESCECDTAATSCECDTPCSSAECDDACGCWFSFDNNCGCDKSCDCDTPAASCECDTPCASTECDAAERCTTSCEKDESCEADESCECDEVVALKENGGEGCDAACDSCGLELCACCDGLVRRSQTLCCPPLPTHARWQTEVAISAEGGDCAWDCKRSFPMQKRSGSPPTFGEDVAPFGWSPDHECCHPPPRNAAFNSGTGCSWTCDIIQGWTRAINLNVFAPTEPHWGCRRCRQCPKGSYCTAECTATAQTTCTPCDECGNSFADAGGCTGEQNRICLGAISHVPYPNPIYTNDDAVAIEFTVSGIHGAGASVTITPVVVPEGMLVFEPAVVSIAASTTASTTTTGLTASFSVTASSDAKAGKYKVSYKIDGSTACPCRPETDDGLPCQQGCVDGSGFMPMPAELVLIQNTDHISVFERLGIAVGVLPVSPAYTIPAFACDEALDGFEFVSTHPWQKSSVNQSRAEQNAEKCTGWVEKETTETEMAWITEVERTYPCPCAESLDQTKFTAESDLLRQLSLFFQLSRYERDARFGISQEVTPHIPSNARI